MKEKDKEVIKSVAMTALFIAETALYGGPSGYIHTGIGVVQDIVKKIPDAPIKKPETDKQRARRLVREAKEAARLRIEKEEAYAKQRAEEVKKKLSQ